MSFGETLKSITKVLTGEAVLGVIDNVKDGIERVTKKVIKASALYIIFLLGLLFFLVGLANWLQAYYTWLDGAGFLVIGLALIILGFIVKALK